MRILVVEDDYFLASQMMRDINGLGDQVVGPFADVHDAILCSDQIDAAILDIKLGEEDSFHVADSLRNSEIPFLFLTGYDPHLVPSRFCNAKVYNKPSHTRILLQDLHQQRDIQAAEATSSLEGIVMEMLVRAQGIMHDRNSAERLVEAVLKAAIERSSQFDGGDEVARWLFHLMEEELRLRCRNYLN